VRAFQMGCSQFEKALLKDDTQNFLVQHRLRLLVRETDGQAISRFHRDKLRSTWDIGKLKKVQRAIHRIDGKKSRLWRACELIANAIQEERNVNGCDPSQWTYPNTPVERTESHRRELTQGCVLGDVWT